MSETRPPITAGPIERAFRFLKSTSVNCSGVAEGEGGGVSAAGNGDVVLSGEGAGVSAGEPIGDVFASSCANRGNAKQSEANNAQ